MAGSGFTHDVAGGSGDLVADSLQSPNFETGIQGWQVTRDGDAEFNNVVSRGSFEGSEFIINDAGAFFYSASPAAGNLIASITSGAGSDPFGNPYLAGFNLYAPGDATASLVNNGNAVALQFRPPGMAHLTDLAQVFSFPGRAGLADEYMWLVLTGGKVNGLSDAAMQLVSEHADGSVPAQIIFEFGGIIATTLTASGFSSDTWHAATLVNSWAGSGGAGGLFYQLTPDGQVRVIGDIINTTATGNSTCFTLPVGYRPGTSQNRPAAWNNVVASNAASVPWVNVSTAGVVQITGIPAGQANKEIFFDFSLPLAVL